MTLFRATAPLLLALALPAAAAGADAPARPAPAPPVPLVDTVITSDDFEAVSTAKETTFHFRGNVRVTATNLVMTCADVVVVARRGGDPAALLGKQEKLKSLVATGGVRLVQDDREALADRAEIFPDTDRVVLTGNPVIVRSEKEKWDQRGPMAELLRGERKAIFKSKDGQRPQTTLPGLKDLGYDKVPEKKQPAPDGAAPRPPSGTPTDAPPAVSVPLPPPPK
ncbi:MAG: hypothetical protein HZC55_19480 [Verrucomicrobia bacterium]|nr:hypothetical protein [Verrucomicrobiota bacterium]